MTDTRAITAARSLIVLAIIVAFWCWILNNAINMSRLAWHSYAFGGSAILALMVLVGGVIGKRLDEVVPL